MYFLTIPLSHSFHPYASGRDLCQFGFPILFLLNSLIHQNLIINHVYPSQSNFRIQAVQEGAQNRPCLCILSQTHTHWYRSKEQWSDSAPPSFAYTSLYPTFNISHCNNYNHGRMDLRASKCHPLTLGHSVGRICLYLCSIVVRLRSRTYVDMRHRGGRRGVAVLIDQSSPLFNKYTDKI